MRICMVSGHACIRVVKESLALIARGHAVETVSQRQPFGFNHFDSMMIYRGGEMLKRTIKASKADIFHVHNEPDWMVRAVREATDKPIIFDIHDLNSLRHVTEPNEEELNAFAMADAFVHVSEPCKAYAEKYHGEHRCIVLHPYMPNVFVDTKVRDVSWDSICYEGGLSEKANPDPKQFNIRFLAPIVKKFIEQDFNFYLFPAGVMNDGVYENLGAHVAYPSQYPNMLAGLRACGFGLVGAGLPVHLMEAAMPNKLFEYMSQGVVPVMIHASEASKFAAEHEVGITLTSIDGLKEQLKDGPKIRKNVLKKRHDFIMENHIDPLIDLYEELV